MPDLIEVTPRDLETIAEAFSARATEAGGTPLSKSAALNIISRGLLGPRHDWGAIRNAEAPVLRSQRASGLAQAHNTASRDPEAMHSRRQVKSFGQMHNLADLHRTPEGLDIHFNDPRHGAILVRHIPRRALIRHLKSPECKSTAFSEQAKIEFFTNGGIGVSTQGSSSPVRNRIDPEDFRKALAEICDPAHYPGDIEENTGLPLAEFLVIPERNLVFVEFWEKPGRKSSYQFPLDESEIRSILAAVRIRSRWSKDGAPLPVSLNLTGADLFELRGQQCIRIGGYQNAVDLDELLRAILEILPEDA